MKHQLIKQDRIGSKLCTLTGIRRRGAKPQGCLLGNLVRLFLIVLPRVKLKGDKTGNNDVGS